ncbi:hypothetical protein [Nitrosopumilus sp.]|uniref:capsular polysaccharide export protein, LipB/KpsS family n=1 Tax=Nitrosopumilus sp. TaxID=2024843 RepID=UPI003D1213BE
MKKKIIFWLNAGITQFAIAYYLQKNFDCDLYAVIDITNRPKPFFQNQQLVNFKKIWFLHDNINFDKAPNLEYLKNFEIRNDIKLWTLLLNDRIFNQYNEIYHFNEKEMLSIITQECDLFEDILDHVQPDFFITEETALRHHHLFYLLCRSRKIQTLMLNHANFQSFCYISQERHKFDNLDSFQGDSKNSRSFSDLKKLLKEKPLVKHLLEFNETQRSSKDKINAGLEFLSSPNTNLENNYYYFGRNKFKVLNYEISEILKKRSRQKFIDENLLKTFDTDEKFIFFPLHQEPERSLLIAAPYFTNQIEIIRFIAKSIPIDYKLYVKEHPTQGPVRGWRDIEFYKNIMSIPNVRLLHPSLDSEKLIQSSSLVISIGGTTSFEAAFYEKPSMVFADLGYNVLSSVTKINSITELPTLILSSLKNSVSAVELDSYVRLLENNSFSYDYLEFELLYHKEFYHGGNLVDVEIPEEKMVSFLTKHKEKLEFLTSQYIKKIELFDKQEI